MAPRPGTIKWNLRGFEDLRRSPGVNALLNREVDRILEGAGGYPGDYKGGVEPGRTRSRGYVVTNSVPAMRREAKDHALLRALGGGV